MTPVYLHHLFTWTPPHVYSQSYARDRMRQWLRLTRSKRLVGAIYNRSGIERRHSVLPDFMPDATPHLFTEQPDGTLSNPSTGERNTVFAQQARIVAPLCARRLFEESPGFKPTDITHVITVSCTGFYNPGPDYDIVRGLGLRDSVERYHIGFMGCYAALPALNMARQFCRANPDAVALIVCLEFCTLHLQMREDEDCILGNALFADGAAAALVSAREPCGTQPFFELSAFQTALVQEGRNDMAWDIGDTGFNIKLSSYVPFVIGDHTGPVVDRLLAQAEWTRDKVEVWAIHPGGRAILDKLEAALSLSPDKLRASREVLRCFGNMSSATILFVLDEILRSCAPRAKQRICAMAFGPGLTVESALLTCCSP